MKFSFAIAIVALVGSFTFSNAANAATISLSAKEGGQELLNILSQAQPKLSFQKDGFLRIGTVKCSNGLSFGPGRCVLYATVEEISDLEGASATALQAMINNVKIKAFPGTALYETAVESIVCAKDGRCEMTIDYSGGAI